jgi:ectoine hydroxylase-related dioxygenase (phytanoyl-CoA dioxygenase family)
MNAIKNEFNENGYIFLKNFFKKNTALEILEHIKELTNESRYKSYYRNGDGLFFYNNLFLHSKYLRNIIADPRIVKIMNTLIGKDVWVCWDQVVQKLPGGEEFPWHQDNGYYKSDIPHYQLWIALSPNSPENGGLQLIPKSNKNGYVKHKKVGVYEVIDEDIDDSLSPKLIAEPGDVILFSSFTYHRTAKNITKNDVRWAYIIEYMSLYDEQPQISPPYFIISREGEIINDFN